MSWISKLMHHILSQMFKKRYVINNPKNTKNFYVKDVCYIVKLPSKVASRTEPPDTITQRAAREENT